MDVCPCNGNLLAVDTGNLNIKIFDKRAWKIINAFESVHEGNYLTFDFTIKFESII